MLYTVYFRIFKDLKTRGFIISSSNYREVDINRINPKNDHYQFLRTQNICYNYRQLLSTWIGHILEFRVFQIYFELASISQKSNIQRHMEFFV